MALDANPIAVSHCEGRFAGDPRVTVVGPLPVRPGMGAAELPPALAFALGRCDVVVSELLGSFGDNELMCGVKKKKKKGGGGVPEFVAPRPLPFVDLVSGSAALSLLVGILAPLGGLARSAGGLAKAGKGAPPGAVLSRTDTALPPRPERARPALTGAP